MFRSSSTVDLAKHEPSHVFVDHLRDSLSESICEGFSHDEGVVIEVLLVLRCQMLQADTSSVDEHAQVVWNSS